MTEKQERKIVCGNRRHSVGCDRFIPPRRYVNLEYSQHSISNCDGESDVDILDQNKTDWPMIRYKEILSEIYQCNELSRILPFSDCKRNKNRFNFNALWPVSPRHKPALGPPLAILDLPNFVNGFDRNLLDWGKTNYIAAALWDSVYLWNAVTSQTVPIRSVTSTAIRWNFDGSSLFTASKDYIRIFDAETMKPKTTLRQAHCMHFPCLITAVDWCPFGKIQAAGCDHGGVAILNENGIRKIVNKGQNLEVLRAIVSISFSYNIQYIAASSFDSVVNIWTFPDGQLYFRIEMDSSTRGMAWHPTKQSYICLGDISGLMSLWNVSNQTNIANHKSEKAAAVHSLTFNELSGELVTSHVLYDNLEQRVSRTQVNVLASFDRVVDRLSEAHNGSISYLKWSPDGTQLATAGSDETLQIWKFMDKKNIERYRRKSSTPKKSFTNNLIDSVIR